MRTALMLPTILLVFGCSYRDVYESIQANQRHECLNNPQLEYDKCMEKANKPYEEYEKERRLRADMKNP